MTRLSLVLALMSAVAAISLGFFYPKKEWTFAKKCWGQKMRLRAFYASAIFYLLSYGVWIVGLFLHQTNLLFFFVIYFITVPSMTAIAEIKPAQEFASSTFSSEYWARKWAEREEKKNGRARDRRY